MRISISKTCLGLAFLCLAPAASFAEGKSYVCAINDVYECVGVTGCSRISLADANLAGILLLDADNKKLTATYIGQDPQTDDIENVTVTDKAVLLHSKSASKNDRTWSATISLETGNLSAGISTLDSQLSLTGNCSLKP